MLTSLKFYFFYVEQINGTPLYFSPMMLDRIEGEVNVIPTYERDTWALGVCLYMLYEKRDPSWSSILSHFGNNNIDRRILIDAAREEIEAYQFEIGDDPIKKLLSKNPNDRPNLEIVLDEILRRHHRISSTS